MASIKETAERFFEACETGKGWEGCKAVLPLGGDVLCPGGSSGGRRQLASLHGLDEGSVHTRARRPL